MGHLTINVSAAWLIGLKNTNNYRRALRACLFVLILESEVMCFEEIDN